jgi:hypothetical protein
MQAVQAVQAPAYHMRMKDLVANQLDFCDRFSRMHLELIELGVVTYEAYCEMFATLTRQHWEERDALRQKHRIERSYAKVEKALIAKNKLEPEFWNYYPNQDGRCDTMTAVLKSKGTMEPKDVELLMPAYAEWLLTAKKTNEKGPMNRWELMTNFVVEQNLS